MKKTRLRYALTILITSMVLCTALIVATNQFGDFRRSERYEQMNTERKMYSLAVCVLGEDGSVNQLDLEEYVLRVVLGEVSTGYHPEALKAQAVAARTYTLYCVLSAGKHADGAVCTDHRCCQAYYEPEHYLEAGGTEKGLSKVREAVEDTKGEVLYYNNKLICATYFACSGGRTEDAEAVWGEKYPYLKSVQSAEESSGCDMQQIRISKQELQQYLGTELVGTPEQWLGFEIDTAGGGVSLMRIGAKLYTGVELRNLLNLKSTIIDIKAEQEQVIIKTIGYGHRVGMSQHGANAMAESGRKYDSILMHYYSGVTLKPYMP